MPPDLAFAEPRQRLLRIVRFELARGAAHLPSRGRGERVLLVLHGGPGLPCDYVRDSHSVMADHGYRVVAYDQLGCGQSDKPDDTSLFNVPRYVDEVEAVRSALGLGRVHLLGQSWGTWLGTEYCLKYEENVASYVIANGSGSVPHTVAEMKRLRAALGPETVAMMQRREGGARVFPDDLTSAKLYTFWCAVREEAGLAGVRIHDTRHTYASQGVMNGVALTTVGRLLGHRKRATTAIYAHLDDAALQGAATQAAAVIARAMEYRAEPPSLSDNADRDDGDGTLDWLGVGKAPTAQPAPREPVQPETPWRPPDPPSPEDDPGRDARSRAMDRLICKAAAREHPGPDRPPIPRGYIRT